MKFKSEFIIIDRGCLVLLKFKCKLCEDYVPLVLNSLVLIRHPRNIEGLFGKTEKKHFINVLSTKALIGDTILTSPTRDGTAICTCSFEPREGLTISLQKSGPS